MTLPFRLSMVAQAGWRSLDAAIIGGGVGGLCAAIALRRAGHKVTVYERADFVGEVGASIFCAANGRLPDGLILCDV